MEGRASRNCEACQGKVDNNAGSKNLMDLDRYE